MKSRCQKTGRTSEQLHGNNYRKCTGEVRCDSEKGIKAEMPG